MESIFDPQVVQTNKPITIETQISSIAASLILLTFQTLRTSFAHIPNIMQTKI